MNTNFSERIRALSPVQLEFLKNRLKEEGLDLGIDIKPFAPIKAVEEREYYALSSVQKRLFTLSQFEEGITYNVTWIRAIEGDLDKQRVEEVYKILMRRHETLRTSFVVIDGEPVQRVHHYGDVEFKLSGMELNTGENNGSEAVNKIRFAVKNFIKPFHLRQAPLFRVGLGTLSGGRHLLMIDMHHIISDLTSKRIFVRDFFSLYDGQGLPELKIQYKDFSEWQNSEQVKAAVKKQEHYWLREFGAGIPVINLPVDFERPVLKSMEGGSLQFGLSGKDTAALKTLAARGNTTLFVVMFALYNVLLGKICRQQDIVVGTTIQGRRHAGLDNVIGMFVNTLALRNYPAGEKTFKAFLDEVRQRALDAFENQDYLFEDLVNKVVKNRDMSRNPLFDVFFSLTYPNVKNVHQEDSPDTEPSSFKIKPVDRIVLSMFDLYLLSSEVGKEILCAMIYSAKLFKRETIERFIGYFKEIVCSVIKNNEIKLKDIKISHDLGIAAAKVFEQEEDDFGF
jgi:hypothetical protein